MCASFMAISLCAARLSLVLHARARASAAERGSFRDRERGAPRAEVRAGEDVYTHASLGFLSLSLCLYLLCEMMALYVLPDAFWSSW